MQQNRLIVHFNITQCKVLHSYRTSQKEILLTWPVFHRELAADIENGTREYNHTHTTTPDKRQQ